MKCGTVGGGAFDPPLLGVRVVEIVTEPLRLTGRLLADLGAEVLHVARPVRPEQTRPGGWPGRPVTGLDIEGSALNHGKTLMPFDPTSAADRQALAARLAAADIVIEDTGADPAEDSGWLDLPALRARHPGLVAVSLSGCGRMGTFSHWIMTDAVLHALSGGLSRSGLPGRPPLPPPLALARRCAAAQAAFVTLLAFYERLRSGRGDWLDFSVLDGVVQTLDPGFGIAGSAASGGLEVTTRGRPDVAYRYPIIPCADGHVRLCMLAPRQWRGMWRWMGEPPEFADPSFEEMATRFASPTLIPAIARFFAGKTREALEQEGQTYGVPIAPVLSPEEAIRTEQNKARALFETRLLEADAPDTRVCLPRPPLLIDGHRPTPCPDQGEAGVAAHAALLDLIPRPTVLADMPQSHRPLTGLRVLDLGVIVVGAETGRLLADGGADVVKVENAAFPDGLRQLRGGALMSESFAAGQRNKRSLALDLRNETGKALFLRLVGESDILLSNFRPGTLDALELSQETLRTANPRLVMIDSSAFGATGPGSRRLGYGPLVRATTGITATWRYPDDPNSFSDAVTVYPDHVAARIGALTALALLIRRWRTGVGGSGSIAQAEVIFDHLGSEIAAAERAADHPMGGGKTGAASGVHRCAGDDDWCVVDLRGKDDRRRLAALLGTTDGDGLEQALADWLAARPAMAAAEQLQNAGVPAGAMLRVPDMPDFPYFRERGFFRTATHPALPLPYPVEARPVRSANLADPPEHPAPLMAQHSIEVLRDWLALPDREIATLIAHGVIDAPANHTTLALMRGTRASVGKGASR